MALVAAGGFGCPPSATTQDAGNSEDMTPVVMPAVGDQVLLVMNVVAGTKVAGQATFTVDSGPAINFFGFTSAPLNLVPTYTAEAYLISDPLTQPQVASIMGITANSNITGTITAVLPSGSLAQDANQKAHATFALVKPTANGLTFIPATAFDIVTTVTVTP